MALINQHVVDKLLVTHDKIMYVKMYVIMHYEPIKIRKST
jgi:hypothetical protein